MAYLTAKNYKVINGISFDARTNDDVCSVLANAYKSRTRLKLYFGELETGRDWHEEHNTIGTVERSTGINKIPLLIKTSRSIGGGAILDHCIVKIKEVKTGRVLYQHEKYIAPKIEIVEGDMREYPYNTVINGVLHGRHKTERSAKICKSRIE